MITLKKRFLKNNIYLTPVGAEPLDFDLPGEQGIMNKKAHNLKVHEERFRQAEIKVLIKR